MTPSKGISIVIPAYNEEHFLPSSLTSIQNAAHHFHTTTGNPIEIIVVNNQSTDKTKEIALAHGARVIDHAVRNIASVRNAGVKSAMHNIIVTIDADCWLAPQTFVQISAKMQDEDYIGGALGVYFVTDKITHRILATIIQAMVIRVAGVHGGMICFRKDIALSLGGFPEDRLVGEDAFFGRLMKKHAKKINKKFGNFKDIKINTLDRKEISFFDFFSVLFHQAKALIGIKPIAQDFKYWYKPKR